MDECTHLKRRNRAALEGRQSSFEWMNKERWPIFGLDPSKSKFRDMSINKQTKYIYIYITLL